MQTLYESNVACPICNAPVNSLVRDANGNHMCISCYDAHGKTTNVDKPSQNESNLGSPQLLLG